MTVVRVRPSITNAHSAAVACQCSSRMAPGSSVIETPGDPLGDRQLLDGRLLAVAAADHLALRLLQLEFERRQLLAGEYRVGHVVHETRVASFSPPRPDQRGGRGGGEGRGPCQKVSALEVGHGILP